jgi:hypothetical protein
MLLAVMRVAGDTSVWRDARIDPNPKFQEFLYGYTASWSTMSQFCGRFQIDAAGNCRRLYSSHGRQGSTADHVEHLDTLIATCNPSIFSR